MAIIIIVRIYIISWHETKKFVKICCFVLLPETSSCQSRFCGRLHWSITTSAMLTCSVCPSHEGMPCWVYRRFEQVPANISRRLFERKIWRNLREKYCIGTTFGILEPDGHLRRTCTTQYTHLRHYKKRISDVTSVVQLTHRVLKL